MARVACACGYRCHLSLVSASAGTTIARLHLRRQVALVACIWDDSCHVSVASAPISSTLTSLHKRRQVARLTATCMRATTWLADKREHPASAPPGTRLHLGRQVARSLACTRADMWYAYAHGIPAPPADASAPVCKSTVGTITRLHPGRHVIRIRVRNPRTGRCAHG